MELEESRAAIEEGKNWLKAAQLMRDGGLFAKSLYSLEMALELSIKGVLIALHKNYPKRHDVADLLEEAVLVNNKRVPSEFVDNLPQLISTFRSLLRQRNAAGYGFKDEHDEEAYTRFVLQKFDDIASYVKLCEELVKRLAMRTS